MRSFYVSNGYIAKYRFEPGFFQKLITQVCLPSHLYIRKEVNGVHVYYHNTSRRGRFLTSGWG